MIGPGVGPVFGLRRHETAKDLIQSCAVKLSTAGKMCRYAIFCNLKGYGRQLLTIPQEIPKRKGIKGQIFKINNFLKRRPLALLDLLVSTSKESFKMDLVPLQSKIHSSQE
jgi:hypothetical protein